MHNLNPDRWHQIDHLFRQALELPQDQRAVFIEAAAGDDLSLRKEVEMLLAAEIDARDYLGESVDAFAEPLMPGLRAALESSDVGQHIGPYRIIKEIGRGGMGAVYLAERDDDQFHHQVALKRIKRGMDTDEIVRRFRYERQILASLQHPNIARLLDGGVSEERPYFAMEYVAGQPITAYCDAGQLTIEQRLNLFKSTCNAVQHAHQNLIVHRDLKPSNILVTADGEIKLLDFGIAKLLGDDTSPVTAPETQTGHRVMTPEYASPEQLRGEPITTATDVYALGAVLYELLTGRRPFHTENGAQTTREQPEKPSTAVSRPAGNKTGSRSHLTLPEEIGQARQISLERLRRRLRGDLDTIVLKALQPEPERRYQSAEHLLEDVKRHLAGRPVSAQSDTLTYRTTKFVRRHRFGVSVAALIVVLLVGFASVMAYQQKETALERDKAEEVAAFLEGLFNAADPVYAGAGRPDTLRARDLLARGVQRIDEDLQSQPEVQARMLTVIGHVYRSLGSYEEAAPLLMQALALRDSLYPASHPEVAESRQALAQLYAITGPYHIADSLYQSALRARRRNGNPRDVVETLTSYGTLKKTQGALDTAELLLEEALAITETSVTPDLQESQTIRTELANLYEATSRYAEAEAILRSLLQQLRENLGSNHVKVARALNDLSLVLRDQGRYEEAEPFAREALSINLDIYGPDHPNIAANLNNLGANLLGQNRLQEAEEAHRAAVNLLRRVLGDTHDRTGMSITHLAEALRKKENYEEAAQLYEEVLARARAENPLRPGVGIIAGLLANVYFDAKDYARAENLYREAIIHLEAFFPNGHIRIGRAQLGLGKSLTHQGLYEQAELALAEALRIFTEKQQHVDAAEEALAALFATSGEKR